MVTEQQSWKGPKLANAPDGLYQTLRGACFVCKHDNQCWFASDLTRHKFHRSAFDKIHQTYTPYQGLLTVKYDASGNPEALVEVQPPYITSQLITKIATGLFFGITQGEMKNVRLFPLVIVPRHGVPRYASLIAKGETTALRASDTPLDETAFQVGYDWYPVNVSWSVDPVSRRVIIDRPFDPTMQGSGPLELKPGLYKNSKLHYWYDGTSWFEVHSISGYIRAVRPGQVIYNLSKYYDTPAPITRRDDSAEYEPLILGSGLSQLHYLIGPAIPR